MMKYFPFVAVALLFVASFFVYFQRYYYHYDDAFITYTFARNLAQGNGIVFHPSFSPIQGSSTLVYTLLLALLHILLRVELHTIGFVLSVSFFTAGLALITAILHVVVPGVTQRWRVVFFAALFLFQLPLYLSLGLEIIFLNFVLLLILYVLVRGSHSMVASVLLAMVPLTRLDFAFFIPVYAVIYFIKTRSVKDTFVFLAPVTLAIGAYCLFALAYFGEAFPHSWIAKSHFPASVSGVIRLSDFVFKPSYLLFFGSGLFSVAYFGMRYVRTKQLDLVYLSCVLSLAFCVLYLLLLEQRGAPNMPWYVVTFVYFVQYLIWYCAYDVLSQKRFYLFGAVMAVAVGGSFLGMSDYATKMTMKTSHDTVTSKLWHHDRREQCAVYLRDSVRNIETKKVLLYEAGKIPYYSRAKCYDVLGLVSREALEGLEMRSTTITLRRIQPDIIVGVNQSYYFPMEFLKSNEFKANYAVLKEIEGYVIWERMGR